MQLLTFAQFNRNDGPADAIAHVQLSGGPVSLSASDVAGDEPALRCESLVLCHDFAMRTAWLSRSWVGRRSRRATSVKPISVRRPARRSGVLW